MSEHLQPASVSKEFSKLGTPLKNFKTIVSIKRAASKLQKRGRHYAIKRLAVEGIVNLLEEPENQASFISLNGIEKFRALLEKNLIYYPEQKKICQALFHVSKNDDMRLSMYDHGFMDIVRHIVTDSNDPDLVFSILRALKFMSQPIEDRNVHKHTNAVTHLIPWNEFDLQFITSLLIGQKDIKTFKISLDIVRNIGCDDKYASVLIAYGGPQLLTCFFEASCSCTSSEIVRKSAASCIAAIAENSECREKLVSSRTGKMPDAIQLQEILDVSNANKKGALYIQQQTEQLRSATRCILDLSRGCKSAKEWMSHQQFVVALLQVVREKDIISVRCSAMILAELTGRSTVCFMIPYIDYVIESALLMESDKIAQVLL